MAESKVEVAVESLESCRRRAIEASKRVLKIESLRVYQVNAMLGLLQGRDVLVAQPTGSGKSVVYQLIPFVFDILDVLCDQSLRKKEQEKRVEDIINCKRTRSVVLVIQPLISLMKDQIHSLERNGICVSRLMHLSEGEGGYQIQKKGKNLHDVEQASILLSSPEAALDTHRALLRSPDLTGKFVAVAVDESHCIVKWGTNCTKTKAFRQDYCKLAELRSLVSFGRNLPFVSLTATALPSVEKSIIVNLQMRSILQLAMEPDRPNIHYVVLSFRTDDPAVIFSSVIDEVRQHGYNSRRIIVFCRSHNHCRALFRLFDQEFHHLYPNYKSRPYAMFHAGTDEEIKDHVINSMGKIDSSVRVVFATTAFGMGVDCKDLYHIIHFGPPGDIDDYLQESGRAGRDNPQSHAILVLYPRCTSGKVSQEMKLYAKNSEVCRRQAVLKLFPKSKLPVDIAKHSYCDICSSSCTCAACDGPASEPFKSFFEVAISKNALVESPQSTLQKVYISDEGEDFLKQNLFMLRHSLLSESSNSIIGNDISSGFPLCAIEEILAKANIVSSAHQVWLHSSLFDLSLAAKIYSLIENAICRFGVTNLTEAVKISEVSDTNSSEQSGNSSSDSDIEVDNARLLKHRANYRIISDNTDNDSDSD
eukprot:gene16435-18070_t